MRKRWHGEAVADEVKKITLSKDGYTSSVAYGDSFSSRRSLFKKPPRMRWLYFFYLSFSFNIYPKVLDVGVDLGRKVNVGFALL